MRSRTRLATAVTGFLLATVALPLAAAAQQTREFQQMQPGSGRFVIIGGGEQAQPKPSVPIPTVKAPSPAARMEPARAPTSPAPPVKTTAASERPKAATPSKPAPAPAPGTAATAASTASATLASAVAAQEPLPALVNEKPPAGPVAPASVQARKIDPIVTASLVGAATPSTASTGDDNVKIVPQGNSLVNEAVRRARSSLDLFVRMAANPPEGTSDFAVKVPVGPKHARESVWVSSLERRTSRKFFILTTEHWSGRLSNEPSLSPSHRMGDRIKFSANEIRDWTYRAADGRMQGNFTACALVAQEGRAKLAELVEKTRLDCSWVEQAAKTATR